MTVKDLKAKLSNIPEEASVEIVMCANDNPLSDGCRVCLLYTSPSPRD